VLGEVLQLADKLLLQQPQAEPPAAAAPAAAAAAISSSSQQGSSSAADAADMSSSTCLVLHHILTAGCLAPLLQLLSRLVIQSPEFFHTGDAAVYVAEDPTAPAAPPVADRFVQVCVALEAAARALATALQHNAWEGGSAIDTFVQGCLISPDDADAPSSYPDGLEPVLLALIGIWEPEALLFKQRQLCSLLSTVQKLSRCQAAGSQQAGNSWGWATAEAAVRLLLSPPGAAAHAGQQQYKAEHLPSVVIFGRCCLVWAEHLGQLQANAEAESLSQALSVEVQQQGPHFQQLLATVSSWVGGVAMSSPAAHAALAAAAGGEPQQVMQHLEALSAAWQAAGEGLNAASLAALVQQLQACGVMLSGIAVPHFCNNPACGNISGPTDVQLVSGPQLSVCGVSHSTLL
jgi:hypothetical protein